MMAPLLVLLLLSASGASAGSEWTVAGVRVVFETAKPPGCLSPSPVVPCLLGHDPGSDPGLGDDTLHAHQHAKTVSVSVGMDGLPSAAHRVDLAETSFEHGLAALLGVALAAFHGAYPEAAASLVDVWFDDENVWVRKPDLDSQSMQVQAHEANVPWEDDFVNSTHVHAPYTTYVRDLDYWITAQRDCPTVLVTPHEACAAMGGFTKLYDTLRATVPNVVFGAEAGTLVLAVGASAAGDGSAVAEGESQMAGGDAMPGMGERFQGREGVRPPRWESFRSVVGARPEVVPLPVSGLDPHGVVLTGSPDRPPWLGWTVAGLVVALAVAFLYHRILGRRALEHPMRQRLHAVLREQPGLEMASLARELGLAYHTAAHHVGILRRAGLARTVRRGRRVLVFLEGEERRAVEAWLLRQPTRRAILLLHQAEPGLTLTATAARLGLSKSTVHGHFQALRAAGLLASPQPRPDPGPGGAAPERPSSPKGPVSGRDGASPAMGAVRA